MNHKEDLSTEKRTALFFHIYLELFSLKETLYVHAQTKPDLIPNQVLLNCIVRRAATSEIVCASRTARSLTVPRVVDGKFVRLKYVFKLRNFILSAEVVVRGKKVQLQFRFVRRESAIDVDTDIADDFSQYSFLIWIGLRIAPNGDAETICPMGDFDLSDGLSAFNLAGNGMERDEFTVRFYLI